MSATLTGVAEFTRAAFAVATAIERNTRAVALATAQRVKGGTQARVRKHLNKMRDSVTVKEEADKRLFRVGFEDVDGRNPMVPVWHEYGTEKLAANPALGTAFDVERARYESEMRAAIESAGREFA